MTSRLKGPAARVAKLLVFALVVQVLVLPQIGGARRALTVVSTIDPLLVVVAVGLELAAFAAYARLTQLLLPVDVRPRFPIAYGTVMASTGVSHVVPGGAAATAAVNFRLLGRAGVPADELGFALGLQAIGSAVVLNLLLWVALVVSVPATGFQPVYATAAVVGALVVAVFVAGVVGMVRGGSRVPERLGRMLGRVPKIDERRVRESVERMSGHLRVLVRDRARRRIVLGMAAANWLLDAAALWVMLSAFGQQPSVVGVLVAFGLANVIAVIPVSPGGLGVIEAVLIPALVGFGTPRAEASIGVVAYRLVNFWLPIPLGALSYVGVERATAAPPHGFRAEVDEQLSRRVGGGDGAQDGLSRP